MVKKCVCVCIRIGLNEKLNSGTQIHISVPTAAKAKKNENRRKLYFRKSEIFIIYYFMCRVNGAGIYFLCEP